MRTTHLRDEQGRMVVIANGDVNLVINHSRKGGVRLSVDVRVASSVDIQSVKEVLREAAEQAGMERVLLGIGAFDAASITLRIIGEVPAQEREARDLHLKELLHQRLHERGIVLV